MLEIYRDFSKPPSQRIIFECKNYSRNVGDTVIAKFNNDLNMIGRHNSKGYLVTNSKLQSGAFELCKSYGIGVIKYNPDGLEFLLERAATNNQDEYFRGRPEFLNMLRFVAFDGDLIFPNIPSFVKNNILSSHTSAPTAQPKAPYLSECEIEEITTVLLDRCSYSSGAVDLRALCETEKIKLCESESNQNTRVLGYADLVKRQIVAYEDKNLGRKNFTIAHEIG